MPWAPELFSAQALGQLDEKRRRDELVAVPYFLGVRSGELDALVESFVHEPELHHPVRGRIKGARALEAYVADTNAWLPARNAPLEEVGDGITEPGGLG